MKWTLSLVLVMLALPGVAAMSWLGVPRLVEAASAPGPLPALQVATAIQSGILVLVASVVGAALGPRVGLSAPVLSSALTGGRARDALRSRLLPALAGGFAGAVAIVAFHAFAPQALADRSAGAQLPLTVRLLYGGITEEVLLRWGLMTAAAWGAWRIFQRESPRPSRAIMWWAIVVSALVFGVSHVPVLAMLLPDVPAALAVYVTLGNAAFGVVAGYLFWRYGLEAAIGAHMLAHVLAYAIRG